MSEGVPVKLTEASAGHPFTNGQPLQAEHLLKSFAKTNEMLRRSMMLLTKGAKGLVYNEECPDPVNIQERGICTIRRNARFLTEWGIVLEFAQDATFVQALEPQYLKISYLAAEDTFTASIVEGRPSSSKDWTSYIQLSPHTHHYHFAASKQTTQIRDNLRSSLNENIERILKYKNSDTSVRVFAELTAMVTLLASLDKRDLNVNDIRKFNNMMLLLHSDMNLTNDISMNDNDFESVQVIVEKRSQGLSFLPISFPYGGYVMHGCRGNQLAFGTTPNLGLIIAKSKDTYENRYWAIYDGLRIPFNMTEEQPYEDRMLFFRYDSPVRKTTGKIILDKLDVLKADSAFDYQFYCAKQEQTSI